ncbi:uncharacterized protein EDB91DRAFT_1194979 [Suillus paluster]|uniref:uncharacterized protein n=1 Tax=Suillus paluster TaxID=48578 RepID=UPI001B85DEC0|nr:uncharacterized protein EDB91DRAFT_1194979 [Suillus paluster]KAG1754026.1 hypothetical protein EDB91DRAFT_1194979 [Suillus paluster]
MATGFRHQCSAIACLFFIKYISIAYAQKLPSMTPVPPLQWLNITGIIQGATPAAVKYSSIGYDPVTNNLIIFGGESSSGIPTDQTYLLNLGTLTWNTPTPQTDLPQNSPPARYMAISGEDFSSSYRRAHLVMGGRGVTGQALSDVWEFDFINQFWSQVNVASSSPPARWGASGGRDDTVPPNPSTTSNTFYMSGGTDGTNMYPLSDVWELTVSGTLSSNLANNYTSGAWSSQTVGTEGYSVNQASTVIQTSLISVSGCNTTNYSNNSCAEGNSYVLEAGSNMEIAPPSCPAPRYGGALVPNMSPFSSSYANQAFLLLGTFNSSLWDDQGGLQKGEVAVLDIGAGVWSRILPAGDPGNDGVQAYPTPREGAVALSYYQALVGDNKGVASDTIVFGGQDESGEYLTEVWILRAYNGSISSSNGSWGAPAGALSTGVSANGANVTIQYITQCAVQLMSSSSTSSGSPSTTTPTTNNPQSQQSYDVSFVHKLLAPLSFAILLPAILLLRLALPPVQTHRPTDRNLALFYLSVVVALVAYGAGVGGLVSSFTSISPTMTIMKRSTSRTVLQTGHGIVGLALFIALYVMVPFLYLLSLCCSRSRPPKEVADRPEAIAIISRANSTDTAEKLAAYNAAQHSQYPPSPHSPRTRLHSWGGSSFWLGRRSREGRTSTDSESMHSSGPQRAFEVVNRPARTRRSSTNGLAYPNIDVYQRVPVAPRSLGDVDWLDRRRSLNAVNELDLMSGHGQRGLINPNSSAPNTAEMLSTRALMPAPTFPRVTHELPSLSEICFRVLFHTLVFALCILSLIALWYGARQALFAVFLLWTVIFYCALFTLAWHGRPRKSILTSLIARFRAEPPPAISPGTPTSRPLSAAGTDQYPFPTDTRGPYLHEPPYRAARGHDDVSTTIGGPRSVETDEDDDNVDEDTRQQRIEEEMGRREVSIVTVPKRRLWITNPS